MDENYETRDYTKNLNKNIMKPIIENIKRIYSIYTKNKFGRIVNVSSILVINLFYI